VIHPATSIDPTAYVHPDATVEMLVSIGKDSHIYPDVHVGVGATIGAHCVVFSGTRIGAGYHLRSGHFAHADGKYEL
jgi:UDP-3-O-[3-hydroxymyristoyl] glucosamine N-acyltransferase